MPSFTNDSWFDWVWFWQEIYEGNYREAINRLSGSSNSWLQTWLFSLPKSLLLAYAYALLGETTLAERAYESASTELEVRVLQNSDDPRLRSALGLAYAGLGRKAEALTEGKRATEIWSLSKDTYFGSTYLENLANIYTMAGDLDNAVKEVEHLLSIPSRVSVPLLQLDPRWRPLRDHPIYQDLLKRYSGAD
jgi:serine/threonine-protein kinase